MIAPVNVRSREPRAVGGLFGAGGASGGQASTVPALTAPNAGTPTSSGTTNATVVANVGSGRLYVGVVTNGGTATNAQIIAGTGGNLVGGASSSNQQINATGTQTVASITGLASATAYQILFLAVAGNGAVSNQSSVNLTTA